MPILQGNILPNNFIWGCAPPNPAPNFFLCLGLLALNGVTGKNSRFALQPLLAIRFIAMKKERNLDKERKNTLPNTVSKLNLSLVNSLRSDKTRLVIVSLRNCRKSKKEFKCIYCITDLPYSPNFFNRLLKKYDISPACSAFSLNLSRLRATY